MLFKSLPVLPPNAWRSRSQPNRRICHRRHSQHVCSRHRRHSVIAASLCCHLIRRPTGCPRASSPSENNHASNAARRLEMARSTQQYTRRFDWLSRFEISEEAHETSRGLRCVPLAIQSAENSRVVIAIFMPKFHWSAVTKETSATNCFVNSVVKPLERREFQTHF